MGIFQVSVSTVGFFHSIWVSGYKWISKGLDQYDSTLNQTPGLIVWLTAGIMKTTNHNSHPVVLLVPHIFVWLDMSLQVLTRESEAVSSFLVQHVALYEQPWPLKGGFSAQVTRQRPICSEWPSGLAASRLERDWSSIHRPFPPSIDDRN